MGPIPERELLQKTIVEVEGEISREWGRLNVYIDAHPHLSRQELVGEFTHVWNLLTRRHMLEMKKTYPSLKVVYQIEFLSVRDADGKEVRTPAKWGRIADGGLKGDFLKLVEVKTEREILRSVSKARALVDTQFLQSSRLGVQLENEGRLLKWGGKKGVAFWFRAQDPVTLESFEFEVEMGGVSRSMAQSYLNMGDGIEASSLFRPPAKSGGGNLNSRGTAAEPKTETGPKSDIIRPVREPAAEKDIKQETGTRKAVEAKAIENRGRETRDTKPAETSIPEQTGSRRSSAEDLSRYASETDPGGAIEQGRGRLAGFEGAAMMLYDRQISNIIRDAIEDAEKHYDRDEAMHTAIFDERRAGKWVLVEFGMLETDAVNSQGDRILRFGNVFYKSVPSLLSDEELRNISSDPEYVKAVVQKLHDAKMPQQLHADYRRLEAENMPDGWHGKVIDYSLLPPLTSVSKARVLDDYRTSRDAIRGTVGRCIR